jgi:hypothetical protein
MVDVIDTASLMKFQSIEPDERRAMKFLKELYCAIA